MKMKTYLAIALASVFATGCTMNGYNEKYGCSGLPDGVVCKTPTQIYDMTNGDQLGVYQNTLDGTDHAGHGHETQQKQGMFRKAQTTEVKGVSNGNEAEMMNIFAKPQFQANSNPMPVLEQPRVLRIWVAPWKDENETLNWGSYMFTEITPRRWNFGESVMRNTPITAPNQADFKSASESMTASKAGEDARNASDKEVANITQSINDANNPKPQQPKPISPSLQKQNELVGQGQEDNQDANF
ncbi:type IV conjugative transfer system lipoprotein TraV [Acinetobacter sp. P1(2025)]|uniref:type IV conjugative transfer system lipoprotein TraV n=1 Tax=Acinetobacter sp. P1(2025) TaxID=3446120 RepID=UPI003F52F805